MTTSRTASGSSHDRSGHRCLDHEVMHRMGASRPVFDPAGPLPEGTTVLEASAGTGKTHTIATLATRYVAEGAARIDELCW